MTHTTGGNDAAPTFPTRILAHVDLDAFFASVEQVLNPKLAGQPVVVGGHADDRSVVASASYEARSRGIKTAMPLFQAYRICPEAHYLRGNYHKYAEYSRQVFATCREFSPLVEQTGIDEGYIDLTGTQWAHLSKTVTAEHAHNTPVGNGQDVVQLARHLRGGLPDYWPVIVAERIRHKVKSRTGLTVSIGLARNKLIAKIAAKYAKPNGLCHIAAGCEEAFIGPLALNVIPGIGRRTTEVLGEYNLKTVEELRQVPLELLEQTFGKTSGNALYNKARGRGSDTIEIRGEPKSISRETTFEQDTTDREFIKTMLYYLAERACSKLRRIDMRAGTVAVKLRYRDFETVAKARSIGCYTDHDHEVYVVASELFERLYTRRVQVRLIGVQLSNLTLLGDRQMHLFDEGQHERNRRLYQTKDHIRNRFGAGAVIAGRAINLIKTHQRNDNGFKLRTPCLSR